MLSPYELVVLFSCLASLILLGYIAYEFLRVYRRLRARSLLYLSASFFLLALSQASSVLSIVVESARLSLTFYTLTSSLAAASFFLIVVSVSEEEKAVVVAPIAMSAPDLLACALAAAASVTCEGRQLRAYLVALSMVHMLRFLSALLLHSDAGALLLALAEVARALATLPFAIFHVGRVVGRE
jgi:hypothetical protein